MSEEQKNRKGMRWLIVASLAVAVAVAAWCWIPLGSLALTPQEAKIMGIAKKAVSENDVWIDRAVFEKPKRQLDGSWTVLVWRKPAMPGGERCIKIDAKGRVIEYSRGL